MTSQFQTTNGAAHGANTGAGSCQFGGAWYIAATVAAFVIFWPIGLAMLAWALWHRQIKASSWWRTLRGIRVPEAADLGGFARPRPSNDALASYLAREQQRLREEQNRLDELVRAFEAFKEAERKANDERDFENFLKNRESGQ